MKIKKKKELIDLDFEITFFEGILDKRPNFIQALAALGDAYTKKGFFGKGLVIDKKLIRLKPEDPVAWYNLACSHSLLNDLEAGLQALNQAIMLGYEDFNFMEKDPDLSNLKKDSRFQGLIQDFKRRNE